MSDEGWSSLLMHLLMSLIEQEMRKETCRWMECWLVSLWLKFEFFLLSQHFLSSHTLRPTSAQIFSRAWNLSLEDAHIDNKIYIFIHLAFHLGFGCQQPANRFSCCHYFKVLLLICRMRHEFSLWTSRRCAGGEACEYHVSALPETKRTQEAAATSLKIAKKCSSFQDEFSN